MLETDITDLRDLRIAELERELAVYHAFLIGHMWTNKLNKIIAFSPQTEDDFRKVVLSLKRDRIDNKVALVAELFIKDGVQH